MKTNGQKHPLAEVFGYPVSDMSRDAARFRKNRLCPFNNIIPNCTKDKAQSPLGVCSIYHADDFVILLNAKKLTLSFVSFVKIFVNFVVRYFYHKGHKGLHKEHKANSVVRYITNT